MNQVMKQEMTPALATAHELEPRQNMLSIYPSRQASAHEQLTLDLVRDWSGNNLLKEPCNPFVVEVICIGVILDVKLRWWSVWVKGTTITAATINCNGSKNNLPGNMIYNSPSESSNCSKTHVNQLLVQVVVNVVKKHGMVGMGSLQ